MDRRTALRTLAASGAGLAGATVVSRPAFADGATSPACGSSTQAPVVNGGGGQPATVQGPFGPNTGGTWDVQAFTSFSFECATGGAPLPAGAGNFQWYITSVGAAPLSFTIVPTPTYLSGSSGWFTIGVTNPKVVVLAQIGQTIAVRFEVRFTCCYGPCANWRCFQGIRTFTFGSNGGTSVYQTGSANCENPRPICP